MHKFVRAQDIMEEELYYIDLHDTINNAIMMIKDFETNFLLVKKDNTPIGVITKKNIIECVHKKIDLNNSVESTMSSPIISTDHESSFIEVLNLMRRENHDKIFVMENNNFVGIINQNGIIEGFQYLNKIVSERTRTDELVRNKLDEIMKKVLEISEHANQTLNTLDQVTVETSIDNIKETVPKISNEISMYIETIINLITLADEIDIEDENNNMESFEKIENELKRVSQHIENKKK